MDSRPPLPPIRFAELAEALLARSDELVPQWLPGGKFQPPEYVCGSLDGGEGRSTSVNLKTGKWADFQSDARGVDLLSLYAEINGQSMGKAAQQVARECGLEDVAGIVHRADGPAPAPAPRPAAPAKPPHEPEGWSTVTPVPPGMPEPTFKHQHRTLADLDHQAEYRVGDQLYGYVMRFRTSDGGKDTLPYTWCKSAIDGACRWSWKQWDEPRPLYFPAHQAPGERTVVVVEGEKKADALQALLDAGTPDVYCVVGWPGGGKAWKKADWAWIGGTNVILWPDCDAKQQQLSRAQKAALPDDAARAAAQAAQPLLPAEKQPGLSTMLGLGAHLRNAHACTVQLLLIPAPGTVVDGWDCADAINVDGWDFTRVQAFFASAHPLPDAPADADAGTPAPTPAAAGGGGDGKKNDGPAIAEDEDDGSPKPLPWWLKPYFDTEKCRWLTSRKMVIAALTHDEALADVLGLNELSNNIEARRAWPWLHGKAGPMTGIVDLMLGQYLTRAYGLPSIPRVALMEAIETVAHGAPYHPVREYLDGLQHDGVSRIDKWLIHVIGESPATLPPRMREYLEQVGRFWLLGMVNRVMEPGCKFDYCPVLEGPGGLGKSTMVETLASAAYFSDTHFDVGRGKEGQEQVQGLWIYEIAELANFGKAEIGLIKAFITAKVDRYRPSYGRTVEAYARQCVLTGTTNEKTYLRDRTGNRRFWPIPVKQRVNIGWLAKWRDQLFAEAYALYQQGTPYTPSFQDEARLFAPMQESRLIETAVLSEMTHVLTRAPKPDGIGAMVNELTDFVTIAQLVLALGVDAAKSNAGLEAQVRSWLEHEGWPRVKRQINGVRSWGYERPRDWPPQEPDPDEDLIDHNNTSTAPGNVPDADHKGADDEPF